MKFEEIFKKIKKITKKKTGYLNFGFFRNKKKISIFKRKKVGVLGFIKRILSKKTNPTGWSFRRFAVLGGSVVLLFAAGFAVAGVIGSFSTGDLNKGLVGHWPLDSAHLNSTTNRVDDISGYGNHGTNSGASLTTDRYGQANGAMSFVSAESDNISCGNNSSLTPANFTISFWMNATEDTNITGWNGIMGKGGYSTAWRILDYNNRAYLQLVFGTDSTPTHALYCSPTLGINGWHLITFTYDHNYIKAYYNGEQYGSSIAETQDLKWSSSYFVIGLAQFYFEGNIQDVRVYNRALSEPEIKKLYETHKPKFSVGSANKGLVGHWPLRTEGAGAEGTVNLYTETDWEAHGSSWESTGTTYKDLNVYKNIVTNPGAGNNFGFRAIMNKNLESTDTHLTLSFFAKLIGDMGNMAGYARVHYTDESYESHGWAYSPNVFSNFSTYYNIWQYVTATIALNPSKTPDYISHIYVYKDGAPAGSEMDICGIQVEQKDHATPFVDGTRLDRTADSTPNSNHGEIYGAEIRNHGASFNGSSDYVLVTHDGGLSFQSGDFTASAWAKADVLDTSYDGIFTADTTGDGAWKIKRDAGDTYFKGFFGGTNLSYSSVSAGDWHYYTMTKSGTTLTIYLNGKQVTSGACPATHAVSNNELVLGSYRVQDAKDGYHMLDGQISDALIYNRALSADEILELYQGADVAGAILDMPLSDKTGFKDISGNNNHGTNYGADIIGEGGYFDGVNDYIDTGNTDSQSSITVAAWVKSNSTSGEHVVASKQYSTSWELGTTGSSALHLNSKQGGTYYSHIYTGGSLTIGEWTFIVWTKDATGGDNKFYQDGSLVGTVNKPGGIDSDGTSIKIGTRNGGALRWSGQISDVRIYNRALSEPEIVALYDKGRSVSSVGTSTTSLNKGLVGQWDLKSKDEKVGGNILTNNPNFESDTNSPPGGWSHNGNHAATALVDGSAPNGSNVMEIVASGIGSFSANSVWNNQLNGGDLISGKRYRLTFWAKSISGTLSIRTGFQYVGYSNFTISTDWEKYTYNFIGDGGTYNELYFIARTSAGTFRIDNITVKPTQTADSTPYGNHGTIYGATVESDYTSFDGYNDWIDCEDNDILQFSSTDSYTISLWFYRNNVAHSWDVLVWNNLTGNRKIYLALTTDKIWRWDAFAGPTISFNEWTFITYTFSADGTNYGTEKFYKNGSFSTQRIGSIPPPEIDSSLYISGEEAAGGAVGSLNGRISNVKIYNRVLSAREVKLLYDKGH